MYPIVTRWGQTAHLALPGRLGHAFRRVELARKGGEMKKGKVLVRVPVTAEEKREMAAIARRRGKSLTAWAEGAIRAAWLRRGDLVS